MATIADIRAAGTTIDTNPIPIYEPLSAPSTFNQYLVRFGDDYNTTSDSHLYKLISALCGDAGVGSIKKQLLLPRLQSQLAATHFNDLDRLYGDTLALPRLSVEIYSVDPATMMMTQAQWQDVLAKDASYRSRCLTWMRAIIEGPSIAGLKLAAEAAVGVECDIFEQYKYLNNTTGITNIGQTMSRSEFVIIPRMPALTEQEKRRIMKMVDKLRPQNAISTIYDGDYVRLERPVIDIGSTSDRFYVERLVTGRSDVSWPTVDLAKGYWVEPGIEKEAPTFAFMDRQEAVTYLSITSVVASSEHVGLFNQEQQSLFSHLSDTSLLDFYYSADRSYTRNVAPITILSPWIASQTEDVVLINNYYPIGYFAQPNTLDFAQNAPSKFWSSVENNAGTSETITYDFGRVRATNFIDFQICQKPIDFTIEWLDTNGVTWHTIEPLDLFQTSMIVDYLPSLENPWHYFECYFTPVETQKLRITFKRRNVPFPLTNSDAFKWSIDMKNFRAMQVVPSVNEYTYDEGIDILGNAYRTDLQVFFADNVIDEDIPGEDPTFWQSQPNPSRFAVEALYFDLRGGYQIGTQKYLDQFPQSDLDTRSQKDMELYYEDGIIIDEVYLDPITFGPDMHIYYSLDDTPEWDNKLWTPVPRSYTLKKGFAALPQPTFVKYVKLEFTNLAAAPYQTYDYPNMPPITFRRHPTWVQDYFNNILPWRPEEQSPTVTINPQTFGFIKFADNFSTTFTDIRSADIPTSSDDELRNFIATLGTSTTSAQEKDIHFYSPLMWQNDLIRNLDLTRALSRVAIRDSEITRDTGWNAELGLPISATPGVQSTNDMTVATNEKHLPTLWFPRQCRHEYQIVQAPRTEKIAYFVAIRNVGFYRRDFTSEFDEIYYVESLDDTAHVELNQFTQDDWRFVVTP